MFTMGVSQGFVLTAWLLVTLGFHSGLSLDILKVALEGGSQDYMEVGAKVNYVLNCDYRTPYDDPVKEVQWERSGKPFYKWVANGNPSVLNAAFLGTVNTSPATDPQNLHFKPPLLYKLAGNYDCFVFTAAATANASYFLHVVDTESGPYNVTVEVLSKVEEEDAARNSSIGGKNDQNEYVAYQGTGNNSDTQVMFENADCTLVWSLSTPAIYPRPNVTCGHYSFDHQDVVERLPAGLTLHKFRNGSWSASFYRTHIQVSSLPKNHRLGCSIRIPGTSYKKVVRAQDNLWVESLIDTGGCPGLHDAQSRGVYVDMKHATYTCRGDVLPADRTGRALASLSCPPYHTPVFPDNERGNWNRGLELSCAENDIGWRVYYQNDPERLGDLVSPASLPICVPNASGAEPVAGSGCSLILALILTLSWLQKA